VEREILLQEKETGSVMKKWYKFDTQGTSKMKKDAVSSDYTTKIKARVIGWGGRPGRDS
jgi:hypothetical protein